MNYVKRSGFSLIEMLVVVFIIGLLATLVGPRAMKLFFSGKESAAKSTLNALKAAVTEYNMKMGSFPSQQEGLNALVQNVKNNPKWEGSFLEGQVDVPLDPWGAEYIYNRPPQHFKDRYQYFEIISYGQDGEGSDKVKWLHTGA